MLLADDNRAILDQLERLLDPTFEIVGAVSDGEGLVKQATALDPEIIVTDISMPGMSGLEAVTRIKQAGLRARVVFITVFRQPSFMDACFAVGADAFVPKSVLVCDLVRALEEVLAGRTFGLDGRRR